MTKKRLTVKNFENCGYIGNSAAIFSFIADFESDLIALSFIDDSNLRIIENNAKLEVDYSDFGMAHFLMVGVEAGNDLALKLFDFFITALEMANEENEVIDVLNSSGVCQFEFNDDEYVISLDKNHYLAFV